MSISNTSSRWSGLKAAGRTVFLSLGYTYGSVIRSLAERWVNATHPRAIHGANLKPGRVEGADLLLQFICIGKGVVSKIHVALKRKCELAIDEKSCGGWFVVQPVEYGFERVQALIKGEHCLGGEPVIMNRHLCWERWNAFAIGRSGEHDRGGGTEIAGLEIRLEDPGTVPFALPPATWWKYLIQVQRCDKIKIYKNIECAMMRAKSKANR